MYLLDLVNLSYLASSDKCRDKPLVEFVNRFQVSIGNLPHVLINQIQSRMCYELVQVSVVFFLKNWTQFLPISINNEVKIRFRNIQTWQHNRRLVMRRWNLISISKLVEQRKRRF